MHGHFLLFSENYSLTRVSDDPHIILSYGYVSGDNLWEGYRLSPCMQGHGLLHRLKIGGIEHKIFTMKR